MRFVQALTSFLLLTWSAHGVAGETPFAEHPELVRAPGRPLEKQADSAFIAGPVEGRVHVTYGEAKDGTLLDEKTCEVVGTLQRSFVVKERTWEQWTGSLRCDGKEFELSHLAFNLPGGIAKLPLATSQNPSKLALVTLPDGSSFTATPQQSAGKKKLLCTGGALVRESGDWWVSGTCEGKYVSVQARLSNVKVSQKRATAKLARRPFRVLSAPDSPSLEGRICLAFEGTQTFEEGLTEAMFVCDDEQVYNVSNGRLYHWPLGEGDGASRVSLENKRGLQKVEVLAYPRVLVGHSEATHFLVETPNATRFCRADYVKLLWGNWAIGSFECEPHEPSGQPAAGLNGVFRVRAAEPRELVASAAVPDPAPEPTPEPTSPREVSAALPTAVTATPPKLPDRAGRTLLLPATRLSIDLPAEAADWGLVKGINVLDMLARGAGPGFAGGTILVLPHKKRESCKARLAGMAGTFASSAEALRWVPAGFEGLKIERHSSGKIVYTSCISRAEGGHTVSFEVKSPSNARFEREVRAVLGAIEAAVSKKTVEASPRANADRDRPSPTTRGVLRDRTDDDPLRTSSQPAIDLLGALGGMDGTPSYGLGLRVQYLRVWSAVLGVAAGARAEATVRNNGLLAFDAQATLGAGLRLPSFLFMLTASLGTRPVVSLGGAASSTSDFYSQLGALARWTNSRWAVDAGAYGISRGGSRYEGRLSWGGGLVNSVHLGVETFDGQGFVTGGFGHAF